jgi:hypothetical protein
MAVTSEQSFPQAVTDIATDFQNAEKTLFLGPATVAFGPQNDAASTRKCA